MTTPARRWLAGLCLLAGLACTGTAQAEPDCPPVAGAPSPDALAAAARTASDRGPLWRIERDGRSSWLYGTIHVGRLAWAFPGPNVSAALRRAQVLALELDLTSPEVQQQIAKAGAQLQAAQGPLVLPAPTARRLARQIALACLDAARIANPVANPLANQSPVMQAVTLMLLSARRDDLDPAYAQEFVLAGFMHASGKPVVSLETAAAQMAALAGGSLHEQLALVEQSLDQLDSGQGRAVLHRLALAWERADLAALASYEDWCECARDEAERAFSKRLNDDRNPGLADAIARLHDAGQSVFAAVGALHMTGPQALPALLQARGFKVEAVRWARP